MSPTFQLALALVLALVISFPLLGSATGSAAKVATTLRLPQDLKHCTVVTEATFAEAVTRTTDVAIVLFYVTDTKAALQLRHRARFAISDLSKERASSPSGGSTFRTFCVDIRASRRWVA